MPVELAVALVTSICAALGVVASAFFQYKASQTAKKAKEESDAERRAENAERELEKERKEKDKAALDERFETLGKQISELAGSVNVLNTRLDKQQKEFEMRITQTEESLRMIVQILSKNAREYSTMMKMHSATESRLQIMMDIETQNLRFSKQLSGTLSTIAEILASTIDGSDAEAVEKLQTTIRESEERDQKFIDAILESQKEFYKEAAERKQTQELQPTIPSYLINPFTQNP